MSFLCKKMQVRASNTLPQALVIKIVSQSNEDARVDQLETSATDYTLK